ncbi:hypothetical protein K502DRAFT_64743 [Neoconidiobolus thromboides FSU 785]|nr:hypothetical protein K502DRAFT_64743 [Neoconidiobolus thromboides FSU 785]
MSIPIVTQNQVKVAIEGCCHGELNKIYSEVERRGGADLVLIGGDFQAIRNSNDLSCLSVPKKYLQMNDFHEYYNGTKEAKYLTIFIGGNHEASNYLSELFYGGWVAKNIYYLGKAGSVVFNGLRISGLSGIYKEGDYFKGHYERPPYNPTSLRSVYHTREYEVTKLSFLNQRPDIMLSHDWPNNIEKYGNHQLLCKLKPFFKQDIFQNQLGSPASEYLLHHLKPQYWFSAHLHVKFKAIVYHQNSQYDGEQQNKRNQRIDDEINLDEIKINSDEIEINPDELEINLGNDNEISIESKINIKGEKEQKNSDDSNNLSQEKINNEETIVDNANGSIKRPFEEEPTLTTEFLSLDKCGQVKGGKARKYLEIIDIPIVNEELYNLLPKGRLCYDINWLAITKALHPLLNLDYNYDINKQIQDFEGMQSKIKQCQQEIIERNKLNKDCLGIPIPLNFKTEAPTSLETIENLPKVVNWYPNSQTKGFCELVGIDNLFQ